MPNVRFVILIAILLAAGGRQTWAGVVTTDFALRPNPGTATQTSSTSLNLNQLRHLDLVYMINDSQMVSESSVSFNVTNLTGVEITSIRFELGVVKSLTDQDLDGVWDIFDNAPFTANPKQVDSDFDGIGEAADNAPMAYNPDQLDTDMDGLGDAQDSDHDGDDIDNKLDLDYNYVPTAPSPSPLLNSTSAVFSDDAASSMFKIADVDDFVVDYSNGFLSNKRQGNLTLSFRADDAAAALILRMIPNEASAAPMPEPASLSLFGIGMLGILMTASRKRRKLRAA